MSRFRKTTMTITALLMAMWAVPCQAAESTLKGIFLDSVYGALTGSRRWSRCIGLHQEAGRSS